MTQGNRLDVNQQSDRATLNWSSFNISTDGKVNFNQPSSTSVALNRIFQSDPSKIFGALTANGQIYLINQNGFLFGSNARVNVGGLLASSLKMSDDTFNNGLLSALQHEQPALAVDGVSGDITVEAGAVIATGSAGQRVILAAPNVTNAGEINTPDGQTILAAGQTLYLQASTDPKLRGLLVEVDGGGTAINQVSGQLSADRGNITMIGLAVNQQGRISATTSINENGSVRLLARDTVALNAVAGSIVADAQRGGDLMLGPQSSISVLPDASDHSTAVDEQAQLPSTVELSGQHVIFAGGSRLTAPGGELQVRAATNPSQPSSSINPDGSRIRVDEGAIIDLAGSHASVPVTRNLVSVELRASELADSPHQRDGALRGKTVIVDSRVGTALANVSGALALTQRDIYERTSQGGSVVFDSGGDVVVAHGATIDVSGGRVDYTGGIMQTSQLVKSDGSMVDIGAAPEDGTYTGIFNPTVREVSQRFGVIDVVPTPGIARFDPGYVEGKSAGSVQFMGSTVVLDGDLVGNAVNGPYQRSIGNRALGGTLIIGDPSAATTGIADFRTTDIRIGASTAAIVVSDDTAMPSGLTVELPKSLFDSSGFSQFELASNGSISWDENIPVTLPPGARLDLVAPRVELNSSIRSAGGALTATSMASVGSSQAGAPDAGLFIGRDVTLDASGLWTNDTTLAPDNMPTTTVALNAGSIRLSQGVLGGQLSIADGVEFSADGGAWLDRTYAQTYGKGGSISLDSGPQGQWVVGSDLALHAFGVQGAAGGTLSITAARLSIGSGDTVWLRPQSVRWGSQYADVLHLDTRLFSDFGFAAFSLSANGARSLQDPNVLTVEDEANIDLTARTLFLSNTARLATSQNSLRDLATAGVLPEYRRTSALLSLAANPVAIIGPDQIGSLSIGSNARITGPLGSSISLASMGSIDFRGSIDAPSGNVAMQLVKPQSVADAGFIASQAIELEDGSSIDVSGTAIYQPSDTGLLQGQLTAGGTVSLAALRGSVIAHPGSSIRFAGASAPMDIFSGKHDTFRRVTLASAGGLLSVEAAESASLLGDLDGRGGAGSATGARAPGGTLSIELTRLTSAFQNVPNDALDTFPTSPRTVSIAAADDDAPVTADSGRAVISQGAIARSGVDSLSLFADDQIELESGVDLDLGLSLVLRTPSVSVTGDGVARAGAAYVSLGSGIRPYQRKNATPGLAQLTLSADALDLFGDVAFQNLSHVTLSASEDIQLIGNSNRGATTTSLSDNAGSLQIGGDLTLRAKRVVASTATYFTIDAQEGSSNTIDIESNGAAGDDPPLTAGGSLTLNAQNIIQAGTVWVPFGEIVFNATDSLTFASGSKTSVSGNGAVIPFGRVDNGDSWVYELTSNNALPLGVASVPSRSLSFNAANVNVASGATIDISGGGDLYAYEWTPGTGGTRDALAPGVTLGLYAILPSLGDHAAPYDPMLWAQAGLAPGASVYLSGGAGLPAGTYTLLPARYALLPGAYLVSSAAGFTDLQPATAANTRDGSTVVAGYLTYGDTGIGGTRYSGFSVRPGTVGRTLSAYTDHLGSAFFTDAGSRTVDAGTLDMSVQRALRMQGALLAGAVAGGLRGTLALSAPDIVVGDDSSSQDGTIILAPDLLQSWNPGRLLLGGIRDGREVVHVGADSVLIKSGAKLSLDEIVLTARDRITVESGATVSSKSFSDSTISPSALKAVQPTSIILSDNDSRGAAVLAVSDIGYLVPQRGDGVIAGTLATIDVANGATVGSRGSLVVDSPGGAQLADDALQGSGARWSLGANQIVFGDASAGALVLDDTLVGRLNDASTIRLASRSGLEIDRSLTLGTLGKTREIDLSATSLVAGVSAVDANFSADKIVLQGVDPAPSAVTTGDGTLAFHAGELDLGLGILGLSNWGTTTLSATGGIRGNGVGGFVTAGNLELSAPLITVASDADTRIDAQGALTLALPAGDGSALELQTGGALTLSAASIEGQERVVVPSGTVTLNASDAIRMESGSQIDVSGRTPDLAAHGSAGGTIVLNAGSDLEIQSGSHLDVSGAVGAGAGRLDLVAAGGVDLLGDVSGLASTGSLAGSFSLNAGHLNDFGGLNAKLEIGGFYESRDFRVRNGDLILVAGTSLSARHVGLTADAGSISIDGTIDASGTGERGSIIIDAAGDLNVRGTLLANAQDSQTRGGLMQLSAANGNIDIASGAVIQARGNGAGELVLRAPLASGGTDIQISSLGADLSQIDKVLIQPDLKYVLASDTPDATELGAIRSDVGTLIPAAAPGIQSRLGVSGAANVSIQPYVDMSYDGDLTLLSTDFSAWRFGAVAPSLSFAATGNLTVDGILSDGFRSISTGGGTSYLDVTTTTSSTLRLAAGSDLLLASGAVVRTGSGDLTLSAGRDILFGDSTSQVYTGGIDGAATRRLSRTDAMSFADQGGDVTLTAGRDLVGAQVTQSIGDWLPVKATTSASWGIDFGQFGWNVGALGGGDVTVRAGRDITSLSAAVADSNLFSTGTNTGFGGGDLRVQAGRDVDTAMLYVGKGTARLTADGSIASAMTDNLGKPVGTLLIGGDSSFDVSSRGSVHLEGAVAGAALYPGDLSDVVFFYRYGPSSYLRAASRGGDVVMNNDISTTTGLLGDVVASQTDPQVFDVMPASVDLAAFGGDVKFQANLVALPSEAGQFSVYAQRDVSSVGGIVGMSDAAAFLVPTATSPSENGTPASFDSAMAYTGALRHLDDFTPVRIAAGRDVLNINLTLPKMTQVSAGRDIRSVSLAVQNLRASDVSFLSAARDIIYGTEDTTDRIDVLGPGQMALLAGRDIDFGFSAGVTSLGNLPNANLIPGGADLSLLAGLGTTVPQFEAIARSQGLAQLSGDFFDDLVKSGREANEDPTVGFGRGYAAIDKLFPDSRGADSHSTSPYRGNIRLAFSRVYTLNGGTISMFVPGGLVDVGLANPPANLAQLGLTRAPSDLGIVAAKSGDIRIFSRDDVLVNQSRVFTLGGGDIAIWSTEGNIDAGRGAKSAISAPPPTLLVDSAGNVSVDFSAAVAGSGIRTILTGDNRRPGNVDLIAPAGFVNAGDAGIGSSGNLNIAAQRVIGVDNIQVGGVSTGVPPETSGIGASLAGAASSGSSATNSANSAVAANDSARSAAPLAEGALSWLEVFVIGVGEENCKFEDAACLKRQHTNGT